MTTEAPSERTLLAEIAAIDAALSKQLTAILHHPEFRKLEASWRGLHHLVRNTETSDFLKVRVLNASREELAADFARGGVEDSALFARVYADEADTPGGEPFGLLVGDYEFSHRHDDVHLLSRIAYVACAAQCPFLAAASPSLFGVEAWEDLSGVADVVRPFYTVEYVKWRSFRESEDSRFVTLVLPRCLARRPHTQAAMGHDYAFQEVEQPNWMNGAYAFASVLTAAQARTGLCVDIRGLEGGGLIETLPSHPDRRGGEPKAPTEVGIDERHEVDLGRLGFTALCRVKGTGDAVCYSARTVHESKTYTGPTPAQAREDAAIASRLPFVMTAARFMHYLRAIARARVGLSDSREELANWLNAWLRKYVNAGIPIAPLREARVEVQPVGGRPGASRIVAHLRPWLGREELSAPVRWAAVFVGS
jgi:type VI secretion system protein ImpC